MKYYFFLILFNLITEIKTAALENACLYPILLKSWESNPKGKKKFIITNKKKEKISEGVLEWDLIKNEWIFYYESNTIYIRNGKVTVIKNGQKKEKVYQCPEFARIFSQSIDKWDSVMPFDNEIKMDNTCYTEFKTNKSYIIFYFQPAPFKLISITFGEGKESHILSFEEGF